jgi:parallel beta-helix repeat protein
MNRKTCLLVLVIFFAISLSVYPANFTVNVAAPSGGDDTAVVQAALDTCVAHGLGCTVQLAAGTYMTQQLFAGNFHGTFKGKGMDVSIIQALPLKGNPDNPGFLNPPSVTNPYPFLVTFLEGDIVVSDMTIKDLETIPIPDGWYDQDGFFGTYLFALLQFMGESPMNVVVERVGFEGTQSVPFTDGYNVIVGPSFGTFHDPLGRQLPGTFRVSSCRSINLLHGIWATALRDAHVIIGGSPSAGNVITNCNTGGGFANLSNSSVVYSHNNASVIGPVSWAGFFALQELFVEMPTSFLIKHNNLKVSGSYESGIWIDDFGPLFGSGKLADAVISNNTIVIEPSEYGPAAVGIETTDTVGTLIFNNHIVGSGLLGISIEGSTQCMVKANNVNGLTADIAPIALWTPPWLIPPIPTTDSTVVGSGKKTNVYDEGINNTLVGVNNMNGNPPGPAIRDAMKRKMEAIKSLPKH